MMSGKNNQEKEKSKEERKDEMENKSDNEKKNNNNEKRFTLLRDLINSLASLDHDDSDKQRINSNHDASFDEKRSGGDLNGNINNSSNNNSNSNNSRDNKNNKHSGSNCNSTSSSSNSSNSSNSNASFNGVIGQSLSRAFYSCKIPLIDKTKPLPLVPLYILPTNDIQGQLESLNKPHILQKLLERDPNLAAVALENDCNLLSQYFATQRDCILKKIRLEKIRRITIKRKLNPQDPQRRRFDNQKIERLGHIIVTHIIDRYLNNIDAIFGFGISIDTLKKECECQGAEFADVIWYLKQVDIGFVIDIYGNELFYPVCANGQSLERRINDINANNVSSNYVKSKSIELCKKVFARCQQALKFEKKLESNDKNYDISKKECLINAIKSLKLTQESSQRWYELLKYLHTHCKKQLNVEMWGSLGEYLSILRADINAYKHEQRVRREREREGFSLPQHESSYKYEKQRNGNSRHLKKRRTLKNRDDRGKETQNNTYDRSKKYDMDRHKINLKQIREGHTFMELSRSDNSRTGNLSFLGDNNYHGGVFVSNAIRPNFDNVREESNNSRARPKINKNVNEKKDKDKDKKTKAENDNSNNNNNDDDDKTCQICCENKINVCGTCGHLFCNQCVVKYYNENGGALVEMDGKMLHQICCFTCRKDSIFHPVFLG